MHITKDQFRANMLNAINEGGVTFSASDSRFIITLVKEENVKYNSFDEYLHRWMFNEKNLNGRYFNIEEVVDFLFQPDQKFPFWIKILHNENVDVSPVFELRISMRFRTPTQLKFIETGHPPFTFQR